VPSTSLLPLPLSLDNGIQGNGHDTSSLNSISLELTDHGGIEPGTGVGAGAGGGVSAENVSDSTVVIMGVAEAVDSDSEDEGEGLGLEAVPVPIPIPIPINGVNGIDSSDSSNDISSDHAAFENFNVTCPPTVVVTQSALPAQAISVSASAPISASITSSSHTSAAVPVEDEVAASFPEGGDDIQALPYSYSDPGSVTDSGNGNEAAAQGLSRKRNRAVKDK
jgi:hypothetical protein